jgi:transposase
MLRIQLTPEDQTQLTQLVRQSPIHRVRQRSQALLWSHQGKSRQQIADLCAVKADTVTAWFRRWRQKAHPDQLPDAARSGRPPQLNQTQKKTSSGRWAVQSAI